MFSRLSWVSLVVVAAAFVGCPKPIVAEADAGPGPGEQFQICSDVSECPGFDPAATTQTVRCEGVCLFVCNGVDEACPSDNMFCDFNGTCAFGCRDSSRCAAGEICVAGLCSVSAAECSSKCDCDPGEKCVDTQCVPASDSCSSGAECPRGPLTPTDQCEAFQCNGFSNTCFDPAPQDRLCTAPADCVGRPGCLGGTTCTCTAQGACVTSASCTVQNEQQVCGFGNFCDSNNTCAPLPLCPNGNTDCSGFDLVCNQGTGSCERSQPCTTNGDCTIAPATHCANNFCTIPNCTNGGVTCTAPQTCNAQGRCTQPGGTACTSDNVCPANQYCDLGVQECAFGCRTNADCPGQVCNGDRQCVNAGGGSGGQFGASCTTSTDCQSPLICGFLTGTCAEPCASPADCIACNAQSGNCQCNGFGFCQP